MAKKRKLTPKSAASAAAVEAKPEPEPQQEQLPEEQEQKQHEEQEIKQEEIQTSVEDPEAVAQQTQDREVEVKGEEEDEEQENDESAPTEMKAEEEVGVEETEGEEEEEEDEEPVQKLLEPFTKDQLIDILVKAADIHSDVLDQIRKLSDTDPTHRKIFVHGLGWDTNAETLTQVFGKYGEIEDMNAVVDKITGKSKGYAFILFKSKSGARKALKEPQKKIGTRMTACQLASAGPVPTNAHSQLIKAAVNAPVNVNASEYTQRKIYVSNVAESIDPQKLVTFFSKFGEIEEGPLGLDKATGKPRGFALFVYKSIESARKALEEPHKPFEGHILHCQQAIDGPKPNKANNQYQQQSHGGGRPSKFARTDKSNFGGSHLMAQSGGSGLQYNNQGGSQGLNPVIGHALTAMLASQGGGVGGGLGLTNLLGNPLGNSGVNLTAPPMMNNAIQGGYGNQFGTGYGSQPGMQGGYSHSQMGQGSGGRSQRGGYMGGINPYTGH